MNVLDAISTRRSIRRFTGEIINDEQLKTILKAGFQAPSAHNRHPREYIVVRDKEILQGITDAHKYAKMVPDAGTVIVVCGNKEKQEDMDFITMDCSAAIQNMLLAAHSLDLGAVWCALYPGKDLVKATSELLELPDHIIPISMVVVGVKARETDPRDRYDKSCIKFDKW